MSGAINRLHRLSGIVIALFLVLHLTNHLFALGGPELHITVMNLFRHFYRFWAVEVLLLLCVAFQIISGMALVYKKGFRKQPLYVVIQVLSGLYLSFFMIYHVRAVMLGRYEWNVDTDFYFAASVANIYPEKIFFIPYYTLSIVCVFAHISCVHYAKRIEKLEKMPEREDITKLRRKYMKETAGICIAGAVITGLIMIAFTGVLYEV